MAADVKAAVVAAEAIATGIVDAGIKAPFQLRGSGRHRVRSLAGRRQVFVSKTRFCLARLNREHLWREVVAEFVASSSAHEMETRACFQA